MAAGAADNFHALCLEAILQLGASERRSGDEEDANHAAAALLGNALSAELYGDAAEALVISAQKCEAQKTGGQSLAESRPDRLGT